jgi:hypothetical protein
MQHFEYLDFPGLSYFILGSFLQSEGVFELPRSIKTVPSRRLTLKWLIQL